MTFTKALLGHFFPVFRTKNILYLKDAGVVYFVIPKAGNTSIRHFLLPLHNQQNHTSRYDNISQEIDWTYITPSRFLQIKPKVMSFSVTRDPIDRFYATFKAKIRATKVPPPFEKLGFLPNMTLLDFAKHACALSDFETEYHLKSQHFLTHSLGKSMPSQLFDMSEISNAAIAIQDWAAQRGMTTATDIQHMNKTNAKIQNIPLKDRLKAEFDSDAEYALFHQLIRTRYAEDFQFSHYKYT